MLPSGVAWKAGSAMAHGLHSAGSYGSAQRPLPVAPVSAVRRHAANDDGAPDAAARQRAAGDAANAARRLAAGAPAQPSALAAARPASASYATPAFLAQHIAQELLGTDFGAHDGEPPLSAGLRSRGLAAYRFAAGHGIEVVGPGGMLGRTI